MANPRLCSIPDCGKPHRARGYCGKHLMRVYAHGDPRQTRCYEGALCKVDGCASEAKSLGMCRKHYARTLRHGDPSQTAKASNGERREWIEAHAYHEGDECLIFPYTIGPKGNASIMIDGVHTNVYRYMCEMAHGAPPEGDYDAAHSCGMRHVGCIHPSHIRWATPKENMDDQSVHGTRAMGERTGTAKLTAPQVLEIKRLKGTMSRKDIAAMFGVTSSQVGYIHAGKSWAWL